MVEQSKHYIAITAAAGGLAVVLGAFGAHGLKSIISEDMIKIYQTGVQYQFYHVFAMSIVAFLIHFCGQSRLLRLSFYFFLGGVLIFSGSLYALALTEIRMLGAITPIGGLALIFGWVCLFVAAIKLKN